MLGNTIYGISGVITGGCNNRIGSNVAGNPFADMSFIAGGRKLDRSTGAATTFGSIGSGQNNYIVPGTNHASIFGGQNNQVSGNCSAILGGSGNTDGGNPFVGIFGNGVVGLPLIGGNGVFFVNELVIQNIPVITAGTFLQCYPVKFIQLILQVRALV